MTVYIYFSDDRWSVQLHFPAGSRELNWFGTDLAVAGCQGQAFVSRPYHCASCACVKGFGNVEIFLEGCCWV
jgi:hypothetical protein